MFHLLITKIFVLSYEDFRGHTHVSILDKPTNYLTDRF